ncbi:MAG: hypothetical protein OEM24_07440 [Paracoccaceae bacterium]|nr:hypothetical protein [Paracoccaceae bacterium]
MTLHLKSLLCAASVVALSACSQGTSSEFYTEAGSEVDEGGFGNPTMNNMMAHIAEVCVGRAKGYIVPDPVVVLDPNSPTTERRYLRGQVRCLGQLNGKYAEVVFREYVQSATFAPLNPESDVGAGSGGAGGGQ